MAFFYFIFRTIDFYIKIKRIFFVYSNKNKYLNVYTITHFDFFISKISIIHLLLVIIRYHED